MSANEIARKVAAGLSAVETIGQVAKMQLGNQDSLQSWSGAMGALSVIVQIADAVGSSLRGDSTAGDLERQLKLLTAGLGSNDDARKQAADAKFGPRG